ncbi:MerR family transcriptional regulator [Micromonosporaceae bacterium Da 78-11]
MWTMDELVDRVREALAAEYPGAPNGRVRDVPDRRAIRWYTTIGLVDRPLGMRGRTALYGPRHLQQLVAVKRRQAEGHSLARIQIELNWISDDALQGVSRVPESLLAADGPGLDHHADAHRPRFWAQSPSAGAATAVPAPTHQDGVGRPVSGVTLGGGAILLVPHHVSDQDRVDIAAAAAPLLDLLEARGLIDGRSA